MTSTLTDEPVMARDVAPRHGHTERDYQELIGAGLSPADTQPRDDHAVRCSLCDRRTWHQSGRCDDHYLPPNAVERANRAAS